MSKKNKNGENLTCKTCGEIFFHDIPGRPPLHCPKHRASKNIARLKNAIIRHKGEDAVKDFYEQRDPGAAARSKTEQAAERAALPELLAIGLGLTDDPKDAAELIGLDFSDEEIEAAAKKAREKHKELIEGRPQAIGKIINASIGVLAIITRARVRAMTPAQVGPALRSLTQAHELITGGASRVYSNIELKIVAPEGETV